MATQQGGPAPWSAPPQPDEFERFPQFPEPPVVMGREAIREPTQRLPLERLWEYRVVNVGMFSSPERMAAALAQLGSDGWELVVVVDKASNWFAGMEKAIMILKRPVDLMDMAVAQSQVARHVDGVAARRSA